ncbi:MAG: DUF1294 domain-containing protein [Thermodesulfovibrionales bacterium]
MWSLLALTFCAINVASFALFALDKGRARTGGRRVPERTLLWLAALGGSPAALAAQQILRHKTRKQPFVARLTGIVGLQAVILASLMAWLQS